MKHQITGTRFSLAQGYSVLLQMLEDTDVYVEVPVDRQTYFRARGGFETDIDPSQGTVRHLCHCGAEMSVNDCEDHDDDMYCNLCGNTGVIVECPECGYNVTTSLPEVISL